MDQAQTYQTFQFLFLDRKNMKVITYTNDNGITSIVIPTQDALDELGIEGVAQKDVPQGKSYEVIQSSALPKDREFRNAWTGYKEVKVDFDKAVDLTKERLRAERQPKLEALDVEVLKNINNTKKLEEIEAEKQKLRDITLEAEKAKTLDELKAIKV